MNERIRELADKAGIGQLIHVGHGEWDTKLSDKELKFAELIVRECADIVSNKSTLETNEDYREGFHRAQQFIWQDINKHFGVE
jgi:hypothetical protein